MHVSTYIIAFKVKFPISSHRILLCVQVNDKTIEFAMYYGLEARRSMEMVGNSTKHDGIYMPACFDHTGKSCKCVLF